MPRVARQISESGFYHVMVRGNGKQILFETDADRRFFLDKVYDCFKELNIDLIAYCLMDNHVHLLVLDKDGMLSTAMARINGSFAARFNASSNHVGHVFQDRFKSKPIDDENYLLEVVRYIHNNPEEAGVCAAQDYRWSSYQEYIGAPRYAITSPILERIGGRKGFKRFLKERGDPKLRMRCNLDQNENVQLGIAKDAIAPARLENVAALPRKERNDCLKELWLVGFSCKQIEHFTGIGKNTVYYVIRNQRLNRS